MPKKSKHPHVSWRDGRPRFQPSSTLRKAGHLGMDLKHRDGRWFNFGEAIAWSQELCRSLDLAKKQAKAPLKAPEPSSPPPAPSLITRVGDGPLTGEYVTGYIYFLWAGKRIKIGFSTNPFARVGGLMTGVGDPLRLFLTVPGTRGDEMRLHKRLSAQRVRGEWFHASRHTLRVMRMVLNEHDGINGEQVR